MPPWLTSFQIHPEFNADNHHKNFALLFLKSPFTIGSHISPVCLPKPGDVLEEQNCVSHGWGKDKFGAEGRYSTILKEVVVPIVENDKCQKHLRDNTRLGLYFELDNSFICAGGQKNIDTCKGDGGSPLTCKQPQGPWFQVGKFLKDSLIFLCFLGWNCLLGYWLRGKQHPRRVC